MIMRQKLTIGRVSTDSDSTVESVKTIQTKWAILNIFLLEDNAPVLKTTEVQFEIENIESKSRMHEF